MTYKKKLIEVALPLEDINREAAREKSIRHGHPSTLHLWWARRPLAACRAVLFASLVDDPSECVPELLADADKRAKAERKLKTRRKAWAVLKTTFEKASAAGMKSVADPGPEPKIEDVIEEQERERLFDIIRELVKWENSNNERVLNAARAEIMRSCNGKPPAVYDPFCGGGSIPLEAQRLGLEAHASDLNPVPVLINKALIEIPSKFSGKPPVNPEARKKFGNSSGSWKGAAGLAEDIRYYGQWIRQEAERRIGHLYPKVKLPKENGGGEATVIAWLWARTVASPNPAAKGAHVPLVRSFWLSSKPGNKAWVKPVVEGQNSFRFEVEHGEPTNEAAIKAGTKTARGTNFRCVITGSPITGDYIKAEAKSNRLGEQLMAIVAEGERGRIFLSPCAEHQAVAQSAVPSWAPEEDLAQDLRRISCIPYGLTKFKHLFTKRQLTALTTLSDLLGGARVRLISDSSDEEYAKAISTYLAFAIDKAADYWTNSCFWHSGAAHLKIVNTFARQAIQMSWDFAEANPFSESSGHFYRFVSLIAEVVELAPAREGAHAVAQRDAAKPYSDEPTFVYSTDPPYYDNINYADLSDFFYIWLRRDLGTYYPELFQTLVTPKASELIVAPHRLDGDKERARRFFEDGLGNAFMQMHNSQNPAFPLSVFYAFKQAEVEHCDEMENEEASSAIASTGWETMLAGLINAGFSIDGTWPMRTELVGNLKKAIGALASSIVLVCRPRSKDAGVASRRDFLATMKRELPEALRDMQKGNIAPVDLAQAAIGPGMAVFSRYAKVLEADGSPMSVRTALALINQSLDQVLAEQEGEFDSDTRWALAWFDQNGFGEGQYGLAETLCTAKNTSVTGMVEAGILAAKGGKVRLLKKEELDRSWDPATDKRLTVWEATHHLVRSLDQGEQTAAALMRKLGPMAEIARDLSYRLYTVCERRKWAQDAIGYNALVLSWPDLKRLAEEQRDLGPTQRELI